MSVMAREMVRLEEQLRRALEGEAWHGPSVLEAVGGVSAEQASRHPIPGAHSIWELVLHIGSDYALVLRRLAGDGRPLTPGEDWPSCPPPTAENWREAVEAVHRCDTAQPVSCRPDFATEASATDDKRVLKVIAALLVLGVAVLLLACGTTESGVREVVRWTARSSLCLLCLALIADGVRGHFFGWTHWVEVLRSLALSHTVHAAAVATLAVYTGGRNLLERSSPIDVLGGALAYVFIFWGALKPRSPLVSYGLFWIWGVFLVSYGTRALRMPVPFGFAVVLLAVAMLVRLSRLRGLSGAVAASQRAG